MAQIPPTKRIKINLRLRNLWVGMFIDTTKSRKWVYVYINLLPMVTIRLAFRKGE
jgi:hypothetical protein